MVRFGRLTSGYSWDLLPLDSAVPESSAPPQCQVRWARLCCLFLLSVLSWGMLEADMLGSTLSLVMVKAQSSIEDV